MEKFDREIEIRKRVKENGGRMGRKRECKRKEKGIRGWRGKKEFFGDGG